MLALQCSFYSWTHSCLHTILLKRNLYWLDHLQDAWGKNLKEIALWIARWWIKISGPSIGQPQVSGCLQEIFAEHTVFGSKRLDKLASNWNQWKSEVYKGMEIAEILREQGRRDKKEVKESVHLHDRFTFAFCNCRRRDLHAPSGLASHVNNNLSFSLSFYPLSVSLILSLLLRQVSMIFWQWRKPILLYHSKAGFFFR